jgi:hypothetical protein
LVAVRFARHTIFETKDEMLSHPIPRSRQDNYARQHTKRKESVTAHHAASASITTALLCGMQV